MARRIAVATLAVTGGSVMTTSSMAASHGTLGSTSKGISHITIGKADAIATASVDDIYLGKAASLNETTTTSDGVCIFTSTGAYEITFYSSNGAFKLNSNDTTSNIPYSINWSTTESSNNAIYNTAITNLIGDSTSLDCNASTNAVISISVTAPSFNAAEPGDYSDVLTLLLKPV